jgi:hypothetical protein
MDAHQLGQLHLQTDYIFENGTSFYEKLGDERAAALLKAVWAEGYRIAPAVSVPTGSYHWANS